MTLSPGARKVALLLHVLASVGWFGSVAVFLVLAVIGVRTQDSVLARSLYIAMSVMTWSVIVTLCLASVVTGLVESLGTPWGLLRHYWVIVKLLLSLVGTALLFLHTRPIDWMARAARSAGFGVEGFDSLKHQLVIDAGLAFVLLVVLTGFSVFKPRGLTSYGRRRLALLHTEEPGTGAG